MKIICIGRNYREHIEELKNEKPKKPIIFLKPDTALLKNNAPFYYPNFSNKIHHEIELVIKIAKQGRSINEKFASSYYTEVGLGIDFTARDIQQIVKERGFPWEIAKAFDGSAVVSSFLNIHTLALSNLDFHLRKNDQIVQEGNSSHMLWKIDELIAYISTFFTLKIGDLIFTGTPKGVGSVDIDDQMTGFIGEKKMFDFYIK